MDRITKAFFFLVLLFVFSFTFFLMIGGCSTKKKPESKVSSEEEKILEQQAFFASKCGFCHDLERIEKSGFRGNQWDKVVQRMLLHDNGANLTPKDVPPILDYLKRTYK